MTIKRIQTGPRMSQAVIHNKTVYLAGQVASGAAVSIQTRRNPGHHRRVVGGSRHGQEPVVVGDHLADGHGDLRGDERGVAVLGGAGRRRHVRRW